MKIAVDTNVLIRAVVRDDPIQAPIAAGLLREAELVAVSASCLCEFVWVLRSVYSFGPAEIAAAVDALLDAGNVVLDRRAAEMGLALLRSGSNFADGVIASEGLRLGGDTFVSFDKKAVAAIAKQGMQSRLLA